MERCYTIGSSLEEHLKSATMDHFATLKALGWRDQCESCYRPPSNWIPAPSSKPYFLRLPLEIRTDILERVLLSGGGNQPIKADILTGRVRVQDPLDPNHDYRELADESDLDLILRPHPTTLAHEGFVALSLTCSQLYQESTAIFFGKNRFSFHDVFGMSLFLGNISHHQRTQITDVVFPFTHLQSHEHDCAFKLLQECSIQKLIMGIRSVCIKHYDTKVKNFFKEDGSMWLRAIRNWQEVDIKVVEVCYWWDSELDWLPARSRQMSALAEDRAIVEFLQGVQVKLKADFSKKSRGDIGGSTRQTRAMKKKLEKTAFFRKWRERGEELRQSMADILGGANRPMCASCKRKEALEPDHSIFHM